MQDVKQFIEQLIASGRVPAALIPLLTSATTDPAKLLVLAKQLEKAPGADEPLEIADYYKEGDGSKYDLVYELSPGNPLRARGIPFDALDRKTQFFTLFADWSRREAEGMLLLTRGDLPGAEAVFDECLGRADQIEVGELRARSYEGLMRVAERRSDQAKVAWFLEKAEQARAAG